MGPETGILGTSKERVPLKGGITNYRHRPESPKPGGVCLCGPSGFSVHTLSLFLHVLIFRAGLPISGPSNQFRWTQGRKKRRIHIAKVPQQHKPTHASLSPSAPVFSNRVFSSRTGWGRSTAVYSPRISPACFELRSEPRFHSCWFPTPSHPSPPPEGCSAPEGEAGTRRVGAPCGSRGVAQTETPRALLHQQSGWTRHQLLIPKTPKPESSTPHVRPQGWPPRLGTPSREPLP